mgnify:CR=1 FL=1
MNNFTILSIIDAIYIIYMLNYFKTTYNFAHPLIYFSNNLLYHPIGKLNKPENLICLFGNICGFLLAGYIISRLISIKFFNVKSKKFNYISSIILIFTIIFSFMNFNAVIYLIPHFILESFIIKYYLNK